MAQSFRPHYRLKLTVFQLNAHETKFERNFHEIKLIKLISI